VPWYLHQRLRCWRFLVRWISLAFGLREWLLMPLGFWHILALSFCQVLILDCRPFPLLQQHEGDFGSKWPGSLFAAGLLGTISAFGFWLASRDQLIFYTADWLVARPRLHSLALLVCAPWPPNMATMVWALAFAPRATQVACE
jgi:hypothetical protein